MAVKFALFLTFHASMGESCPYVARIADAFYHASMTAGTAVMLMRVHTIMPIQWKKSAAITSSILVIIRFIIGVVDVVVIAVTNHIAKTCKYKNSKYWGPVYTIYDTVVDIYVTIIITTILVSHIRSLTSGHLRISITLYTSVIYNNVIRTVLLTILNIILAAFIFTSNGNKYTMIVWPITNMGFVLLIGYDSDITKTIQKLRQGRWQHNGSSYNISMTHVPSISKPSRTKQRPISREILNDPENQRIDNHSEISYIDKKTDA